jgi:ubiquinone/menaquinone biosynthesis C-methylase UbiE
MNDRQPTSWDIASESFLKVSAFYDPFEEPVNTRLITLADIQPGYTVVDIATGIGDPALSVAERVGPVGRVIATDASAAMLDIARTRAHDRRLTNVEFRQLDANTYDFPEQTIDAVVCRWGLMFLTDVADALGRVHRSLKPGRALAAATWAEADKVPIISIRRSIIRAFGLPVGPNDPFRLSSPTGLKALAWAAGFDEADVTRITIPYEFASVDTFVHLQRVAHESRMAALLGRSASEQDTFWRALGAAAAPYTGKDGIVRTPCDVLLLSARKRK